MLCRLSIRLWALAWALCGIAGAQSAVPDDRSRFTTEELAAIYRHSATGIPMADPSNAVADSVAAARFGQRLFFDARLSADGQVACATCHRPDRAFTDGRTVARGLGVGTRNTPTLLNAALGSWFFWDGRSDSQWSQALQVLENPREMGGDRLHTLHVLFADPQLRQDYQDLFGPLPDAADVARFPLHAGPHAPQLQQRHAWADMSGSDQAATNRVFSNVGKALEAFERHLVTVDSPFDRYVAALRSGNVAAEAAYPPAAKRGLKLFVGVAHCELCHAGAAFTDGQFHNVGLSLNRQHPDPGRSAGIAQVRADPFNGAGPFSDAGRAEAMERLRFLPQADSQRRAFKTPSLRNVGLTAPYMHDGRFATLQQVLSFYTGSWDSDPERRNRERTLTLIPHLGPSQRADLIQFLLTLSSPPLPDPWTRSP